MDRVALVTGGTRGIGAAIARRFSAADHDLILTYLTHHRRLVAASNSYAKMNRSVNLCQVDISSSESRRSFQKVVESLAPNGIKNFILCASGGLEQGRDSRYATRLNCDAPPELAMLFLESIRPGGRFIYLTSHEAHFSLSSPIYGPYATIARSKRKGESRLRKLEHLFLRREVKLIVVSSDIVPDTITARLLESRDPGLLAQRIQEAGSLPECKDVAEAVYALCNRSVDQAGVETVYIGEPGARYIPHSIYGEKDIADN